MKQMRLALPGQGKTGASRPPGAVLSGANLMGRPHGAGLSGPASAGFSGADLNGANSRGRPYGVNLSGAKLSGPTIGVNLKGADCMANLQETRLGSKRTERPSFPKV